MIQVAPDVWTRRELRAAVLAMKGMDRDLKRKINADTRATFNPVWREAVTSRAHTRVQDRVIARGARIAAGNPPVAIAGSSTARMRGGLRPAEHALSFEFGVKDRGRVTTFSRTSPRGVTHQVRRRSSRQMPAHNARGSVAMPAFREVAARILSRWVQTIMHDIHQAIEEGR